MKGPQKWEFGVILGVGAKIFGRYVLAVLYGENRPKSDNWETLTPRIAPQPYVVEKS